MLAPLVALARVQGTHLYPYLDDWLLISKDPGDLQKKILLVLHRLQQESHLTPTQDLMFHRQSVSDNLGLVSLPPERLIALRAEVSSFMEANDKSARNFLHLLG